MILLWGIGILCWASSEAILTIEFFILFIFLYIVPFIVKYYFEKDVFPGPVYYFLMDSVQKSSLVTVFLIRALFTINFLQEND